MMVALNEFSEQEIRELVSTYGTPLYLISERILRQKYRELVNAYSNFAGRVKIAYSLKANFLPAVIKVFLNEGSWFDVTTINELYFYQKVGGKAENVIFTSVTEEKDEYEQGLLKGVKMVVISSYNGLNNLIHACSKTKLKPNVLIRINPQVDVKADIKESLKYSKFGVSINGNTKDSAKIVTRKALESKEINFSGFHFHLGSQIVDSSCYLEALQKLDLFVSKITNYHPDINIKYIDVGGGIPVTYSEEVPAPKEFSSIIVSKLNELREKWGQEFDLIVESGRYLVAESSILVSKIVNVKEINERKVAILDIGYHLLLDSVLVKQAYPQKIIPNDGKEENNLLLVGRLCDAYDIFPISKLSKLKGIEKGKLLVFYNVGAYSLVFNMPFHCITKPPVVMKMSSEEYKLVRKRESIDELFDEEGGSLL
jgi:diaminopimelate decarboxylase